MEIICYACGRGENPENTLEAIRHCQSVNPSWRIEMDIQLTKDGEVILFHDETTGRVANNDIRISETSLHEARKLDVGHNFKYIYKQNIEITPKRIPTLEQVLQEFPKCKLMLDIHIENNSVVRKVIELVEDFGMTKSVVIVSKYDSIINSFKKQREKWNYGAPALEAKKIIYSSFVYLDNLFPLKSDILMIPEFFGKIKILTPRIIKHVKSRQKNLWIWKYEGEEVVTIDNKGDYDKMMRIGVDGVFTSYPQDLHKQLGE